MIIATMNGNLVECAKTVNGSNGLFLSFRLAVNTWRKGEATTIFVECTYNKPDLVSELTKGKGLTIVGSVSMYTYKDGREVQQIGASCKVYQILFV